MADIILPPVQLGSYAWRNVVNALREHDDPHLAACADAIEAQMNRLDGYFGDEVGGEVVFKVTATLRGGACAVEG
jgi:hypothetical protein